MPDDPALPSAPIDHVIDDLLHRRVTPPDRARLGKALDRANAGPTGREAGNEAFGRILRP